MSQDSIFLNNNYRKRFMVCMTLFAKRLLKKPSFLIMLLILPCFAIGLRYMVMNTKISLKVGLFTEDVDGHYDDDIINKLTNSAQGLQFVLFDSKEELLHQVRIRGVDCAFVFPEYFSLDLKGEDKKRSLFCYTSPSSASTAIAKEYIHSEIFAIYAYEKLSAYVYDDISRDNSISWKSKLLDSLNESLHPIYQTYLHGADTFGFNYVQADDTVIDTGAVLPSYILGSAKGLVSIFILTGTLVGTLHLYQDKKNRLFLAFSRKTGLLAQFGDILIPALFVGCSGLLTIWICDGFSLVAIFTTLLYCIFCTLYCMVLHVMIPNKRFFIGLMPLLLIGSLVFCPIIIDFSALVPEIWPVRWCFPPGYFI